MLTLKTKQTENTVVVALRHMHAEREKLKLEGSERLRYDLEKRCCQGPFPKEEEPCPIPGVAPHELAKSRQLFLLRI